MKKLLVLFLALVMCVAALVACDNTEQPEVTYKLDKAVAYVKSLYIGDQVKPEGSDVGCATKYDDFELVSSVPIAGIIYDVAWSVDVTDESKVKVIQGSGTTLTKIDVNSKSPEDFNFTLTATVKAGDGTTDSSLKFNFLVPAYNPITFEEYMAAKEGEQVTIEGIVVAINSKAAGNSRNHLFLADANVTGGYYSYQMDKDPVKDLGIEIGMTVAISGPVAPYSGMQEIKGGTARILDTNKKTVETLDITELFKTGADLKNYVGLPVTIKGVEIGTQQLGGTSEYLYFSLNGVEAYVRTYITDFPTTLRIVTDEDGNKSSPDKTAIDEAHAAKFGWTANVTGILILYNSNPYLIPMSVDCFEYLEYIEKTAEEKVATELDNVTIDASMSSDKTVELNVTGKYYNDVTLSYASDSELAVVTGGSIAFTVPETETVVTITVTATCGEVTETKTITVKLSKAITSIADALAIAGTKEHNKYTEEKYLVAGVVTEIANTTYGNLYIKDSNGDVIYIYGLYTADGSVRFDKMTEQPKVGDYIVVLSIIGQYDGTMQLKNAWLQSAETEITIPAFNEIAGAQATDKYTDEKYLVSGTVSKIDNTTYGNIYIQDADGNTLYIYGLYTITGVRFDKMATQPKVGDSVVVYGIAGNYKTTTLQMKNGTLVCLTVATTDDGGNEGGEEGGETGGEEGGETGGETTGAITNIADALAAADGAEVVLTGTVISAEAWNTEHNNMTVVISDGTNSIKAFRLATQVALGDVITVTGKMTTYAQTGEREIDAGCTAVVVDPAPVEVTIPEAVELADGRRVIITGTVTEVTEWNTEHKNMNVTITDGTNTLYIFRLATQVAVGDKITVTGKMGTHEGARQIAAGATAEFVVEGEIRVDATMSQLGYANETAFESEKLDAVITVSGSKGTNASGNVPKYYDNGAAVRIYGGNTFTVSAADGYSIKKIVITTVSGYAITASSVNLTNGTMVVDGITVTITVTDGESDVVITNPASKGNVRIAAIEVVYEKVTTTPPTTPEGDVNTETGDTPNVEQDTENT